jgi:hypothetical protein
MNWWSTVGIRDFVDPVDPEGASGTGLLNSQTSDGERTKMSRRGKECWHRKATRRWTVTQQ